MSDPYNPGNGPQPPSGGGVATATNASDTIVNSSTTSQQLLAANSSRKGVILSNNSTSPLYVAYGATPTSESYTYTVPAGGHWEPATIYLGAINGVWETANGTAQITELS